MEFMSASILVMVVYFVLFAAVHSLLADARAKKAARTRLGDAADSWYRLAYTVLSLVMVMPFFFILAFLPDRTLFIIPEPWNYLMEACQIMAALAIFVALKQTGISYFLGLRQIRGNAGQVNMDAGKLVKDGFYCHLRNPLFFFGAIFLWLFPVMTLNLLAFNLLSTIYFYIGARHEERSLQEEFGQEYEEYRKQVPMFIPRVRCS